MNEETNIYDDSNIVTEVNEDIGRLHIECVTTENEANFVAVILGRKGTAYEDKCVQYVLDEATPIMLKSLEINAETAAELVGAIHAQFTDSSLEGLTGLLAFNAPEDDLWLYEGDNQANNVLELYGCLFTNYSFKTVAKDDERLMPYEELAKKAEAYNAEKYIKPVVEVDHERYMEMLDVLPPQRFDGSVFYVSEALIGNLHAMFAAIGERYFEGSRDIYKTSNTDFAMECHMLIADKGEESE
jgi:hypothetical protein